MDIWKWVEKLNDDLTEAGQGPSARALERLSSHVCDLEVAQADALLPEVKALGKTLHNPWLDVFVGHWEMRNRVGNKLEGETALADAITLFELAHRDDTLTCPQSICVTQDLASCYANMDGPGWVQERMDVVDETLARIDPTWGCFQCLSTEKAEALLDAQQAAAALAYLDLQEAAILQAGAEVSEGMVEARFAVLLQLGHSQDVLNQIEAIEAQNEGEVEWANIEQPRTLYKALALAQLERTQEAWDTLPPLPEVAPRYAVLWLQAAYLLLQRSPERNTWQLGSLLHKRLDHLSRHGAHRHLVQSAVLCARLALQRGALWSAQRSLALARSHVPKLHADLGASGMLDTLANDIDHASTARGRASAPVPAEQLLAWLAERASADTGTNAPSDRSPEAELEYLLGACAERPDDTDLLGTCASALCACSAHGDAVALLWAYVARHTDHDNPLVYQLLGILLSQGQTAEVERLAELHRATRPFITHWCHAQLAEHQGDWPSVARACESLLLLSPESLGARYLLASALMRQQQFSAAAQCYWHISTVAETPRNALWDCMGAASAAQDWALVRQCAQHLEMVLDSPSGPIEEDWGWIIVRYQEDGEALDYYARRTGPVTARIAENARSHQRQHVGDWVVFDAAALTQPPELDADATDTERDQARKDFIPTFALVHTLEFGGFGKSWFVDGVHPGDTAFAQLRSAIETRGWRLWVHSPGDYRLQDSEAVGVGADEGAADLPGVYFTVAAPQSVASLEVHQALSELTTGWPHALCWLRLAEDCDLDTESHRATIERYGL